METTQQHNFFVYIEKDEDGVFVGSVPALQSCHAEGKTIKEMLANLEQVAALCIRNTAPSGFNTFVGVQNLELHHA